jgi:glucose/mannose transport system substrate-binding protein
MTTPAAQARRPPRPKRSAGPAGARALPATLALALALLAATGCSNSEADASGGRGATAGARGAGAGDESQIPADRPIEMFSWWERVGDADALGALVRQHRSHFPDDVIINASAGLSGLARKTLRTRMLRNEPPDTFQANVGADLMQWVLVNGMDARESKLLPLDDFLPDVAEWRRTMPAILLHHVSYDGKIYGVPSNVHRLNSVYYNKRVFEKYGLSRPTSIADFKSIAQKLAGTGVSALAIGSREPWTLALVTFECLLIAREGSAFYSEYLHGSARADDPRVLRTLNAALELFQTVNPDHAKLSWLQAIDLVVRGQAAMTVMGDWATMSFKAHGMRPAEDFVEIPFPGTEETFVFTSDAFSLPIEARNRPGATRLLQTIGSSEGQRVINGAKGALSARSDVVPPDADKTLKQKYALLQHGTSVLALSGIVAPQFSEDVAIALAEMLRQGDIEPVVHVLRSRYALLK